MARRHPFQRGASLIMVMIALAVVTLLVVGAIAFTGSERTAAVLQSRSERMSGCLQAARNLFISKMQIFKTDPTRITLDEPFKYGPNEQLRVRSSHYAGAVTSLNVKALSSAVVGAATRNLEDESNKVDVTGFAGTGFFRVIATCRDETAGGPAGPEQEVEFVVRLGI